MGPLKSVSGWALLVPPEVVTVTLLMPGEALAASVKVAVILVALTTVTFVTVTPAPALTDEPATKPEPVSVAVNVAPAAALFGLIADRPGAGGTMVNATGPLVPPEVVTVTLPAPSAAFAAIVKVAVNCVGLTGTTLLTVIPAGAL